MRLQNLSETFWRSIKFFLLVALVASILFIVLTKFIIKVPVTDSSELLTSITELEQVLEDEKEVIEITKTLSNQIKEMEFDIYQVQKQDDIKRDIYKVRANYEEHRMSSKYKFSLEASIILKIYYDSREKNSSLDNNMELLSKNLTECQANI